MEINRGFESMRLLTQVRRSQDPRRRSIEKMELAIVIETKAIMANARMTTITGNSLLQHKKEGQVGFQTQSLCFQWDTSMKYQIVSSTGDKCQSKGTFFR
jgi:hypothetical protein